MEFLVRFDIGPLPADMPDSEQADLRAREAVRGRELWDAGTMQRIWRIPGRWGALVVYAVADATALHEVIASLPLYPYMRTEVTALADHPFEIERRAGESAASV
jgi:muconolactone D-isomerase